MEGRFPIDRKQRIDAIDCDGRQTAENVGEVILRINAAAAAADENGIDHSAAPAGIGMTNKQPSFASDSSRPNGILNQIVIDFKTSVLQIPDEELVLVQKVRNCLAKRTFRKNGRFQDFRLFFVFGMLCSCHWGQSLHKRMAKSSRC